MTNFVINIAEGAYDDVKAALTVVGHELQPVEIEATTVANDAIAQASNLVTKVLPDEVTALLPYAKTAFETAVADIPAFFAGGISGYVAALGTTLSSTFAAALAAGIAVAKTDALAAVNEVIADAKATVVATPPEQPTAG